MARTWDEIEETALGWLVRTGDPDFVDWDDFAAWLEKDPRHAQAYHRLSAAADEMAGALPPAPVISRPAPARRHVRRWGAAAAAACAVAFAGVGVLQTRPQPYAVETQPGVTRQIALADGTTVTLNGATRLLLDRRDGRVATLERGQALFAVRHNDSDPFRVHVGEDELVDAGTEFDVVREPDGTIRFEVAEGAVVYNPDAENVRVGAGQGVTVGPEDPVVRLTMIEADAVGTWTEGRLDYRGAPLSVVAADLSRTLGVTITAAPAVASRTFRGTIRLDGLAREPAQLGSLLSVGMRRSGAGWEMVEAR